MAEQAICGGSGTFVGHRKTEAATCPRCGRYTDIRFGVLVKHEPRRAAASEGSEGKQR